MAPRRLSWSNLPTELLTIIFENLTEYEDISHCAGVCLSWQSVIIDLYNQLKLKPIVPAFILLTEVGGMPFVPPYPNHRPCPNRQSCLLFNLETKRTHKIILPQLKGRWFSSSSFGWILIVDYSDPKKDMHLLNPFTRSEIKLPPPRNIRSEIKYTLPHIHLSLKDLRVITSSSPLDPNCLVLLVFRYPESPVNRLALCSPGDKIWRLVGGSEHVVNDDIWQNVYKYTQHNKDCCVTIGTKPKTVRHKLEVCGKRGAAFYKGNFYCVGNCGVIFRINFGPHHRFPKVEAVSMKKSMGGIHYLLELNGDLLHIRRSTFPTSYYWVYETTSIVVYKVDLKKKTEVKVKTIGNNVILLGRASCSTFIPESENHHFKGNCIYFIDDCFSKIRSFNCHSIKCLGYDAASVYDAGGYNMSNGSREWPYKSPFNPYILASRNPFNWIKVGQGMYSLEYFNQ